MKQDKWSDLRAAVRQVVEEPPLPQPAPMPKKKSPQNVYLLGLVVLAVSLAVIIVAMQKSSRIEVEGPGTEIRTEQATLDPKVERIAIPNVPAANGDVDDLKRKMNQMDSKLMLLGAAHNNNWHVLQHRYSSNDLVYFGSDWHLNQVPPHIQMSEQDKSWFSAWCQ